MHAYGVKRQDCVCCFGHYKFGAKLMDRVRALGDRAMAGDRARKKRARQEGFISIRKAMQDLEREEFREQQEFEDFLRFLEDC